MVSREFPGSILERCNKSETEKQSDMKDMSLNSVSWIQAEFKPCQHTKKDHGVVVLGEIFTLCFPFPAILRLGPLRWIRLLAEEEKMA